MRKLVLFSILSLGTASFISCVERETYNQTQDSDTIGSVIDVTASFTDTNNYQRTFNFQRPIPSTDMILVYKGGQNNFWKLLPLTQHLDANGNWVKYETHFNQNQVVIEADSNLQMTDAALSSYLIDQRFRVLIVPANLVSKSEVDYSNYNEVIKYFNIDESKVTTIK